MPAAESCAAAQHLAAECGGHHLDPFTAERVTDWRGNNDSPRACSSRCRWSRTRQRAGSSSAPARVHLRHDRALRPGWARTWRPWRPWRRPDPAVRRVVRSAEPIEPDSGERAGKKKPQATRSLGAVRWRKGSLSRAPTLLALRLVPVSSPSIHRRKAPRRTAGRFPPSMRCLQAGQRKVRLSSPVAGGQRAAGGVASAKTVVIERVARSRRATGDLLAWRV
jgi:hypothetical protein